MATCTAKIYLFIGLGTILLGLSSASWSFKEYDELKKKWDRCGFPPKQIYERNDTDLLKACKGDDITSDARDLCNIFVNFTYYECGNSQKNELTRKSNMASEFLQTSHAFYLCDDNLGVRIPEGIRTRFPKGGVCTQMCSEIEAENICRLLVIFAFVDYKSLEAVVNQFNFGNLKNGKQKTSEPKTTSKQESADNTSVSIQQMPTLPSTKPGSNPSGTKPVQTSPKIPEEDSQNTESANSNTVTSTAETPAHGTITLTYGTLAIYGVLFLLVLGGLYLVVKFRQTILSCLRENHESASTAEDGKGSYRKIPAFEKIVPSLDDKVKAKSYIY